MMKCDYVAVEKDLIESINWEGVTPIHVLKLNAYSSTKLAEAANEFEVLKSELLSKLIEYGNKGRNFNQVSAWILEKYEDVLFILDEIRKERLSRQPKW